MRDQWKGKKRHETLKRFSSVWPHPEIFNIGRLPSFLKPGLLMGEAPVSSDAEPIRIKFNHSPVYPFSLPIDGISKPLHEFLHPEICYAYLISLSIFAITCQRINLLKNGGVDPVILAGIRVGGIGWELNRRSHNNCLDHR